jgi:hypothetical protein
MTLQRARRCDVQEFETADWIALDVVHEIGVEVAVSLRKLAIDRGVDEDAAAILKVGCEVSEVVEQRGST